MFTGLNAPSVRSADGNVLHRSSLAQLPVAVSGKGCYLFDSTGKRYLDASGGAAVSCLGHGHPAVIEAIQKQEWFERQQRLQQYQEFLEQRRQEQQNESSN